MMESFWGKEERLSVRGVPDRARRYSEVRDDAGEEIMSNQKKG